MPPDLSVPPTSSGSIRAVLAYRSFARLWQCLLGASLADWLGLLAVTAYANALAGDGYGERNVAIAGVLFVRLLPALLVGPVGGYVADRMDRRTTLATGLGLRAVLFASIPLVGTLWWLLLATLLVEAVNLVWLPTKDALIPDLVPRERLEDANRLNLVTSYGAALPAAALFTGLSSLAEALEATWSWFDGTPSDLAMWVNAVLLAVAAALAMTLRDLPPGAGAGGDSQSVLGSIVAGWSYIARTPLVRGLVGGIVGAFAAGGVVIGLARVYVSDLGAGDPGYGVLFGAVFLGLAAGMWFGPRVNRRVPRERLFGLSIAAAGVPLVGVAVSPHLFVSAVLAVALGSCAGVGWITGYTLLGLEVEQSVRGRTFAFVQSAIRLVLAAVLAVAPLVAGLVGRQDVPLGPVGSLSYSGAQLTFVIAALLAVVVGVSAHRQMRRRDPDHPDEGASA
ncbi:MAG: MFS transporter [Actinomycetota bacterium]|nr:MFS transporter [Actinomycetota bacterium]